MKRRTLLRSLAGAAIASALPACAAWPASDGHSPSSQDDDRAIRLNQLGFLPRSTKRASIVLSGTDLQPFSLRDAVSQQIVYRGRTSKPFQDEASGDIVAIADFSPVHKQGRYVLEAAGHRSSTFPVRDGSYAGALRSAMRGFHGQRCGCAVDLGNGYHHGACHAAGGYYRSSGRSGSGMGRPSAAASATPAAMTTSGADAACSMRASRNTPISGTTRAGEASAA